MLYICCIPVRGYGFKENEASEEMVEYLEKLKKTQRMTVEMNPRICVVETSRVNDNKKEERKFDGNGRNRSWFVDHMKLASLKVRLKVEENINWLHFRTLKPKFRGRLMIGGT